MPPASGREETIRLALSVTTSSVRPELSVLADGLASGLEQIGETNVRRDMRLEIIHLQCDLLDRRSGTSRSTSGCRPLCIACIAIDDDWLGAVATNAAAEK